MEINEMRHIPLAVGHPVGNEQKLIKEAFDTNWIAPLGPHVDAFEKEMAKVLGTKFAAATSAGTAAIHLALIEAGVKDGDTVISSDMTFAATCNPAVYQRAKLVFVDSNPETFNMDPDSLELALKAHPETKAVIVAHLYGQPADMDKILSICEKYKVTLIEDAAEALGSSYHGKMCGSFGKYNAISFNGNKIITTSGGGMLLSDDEEGVKHVRFLATQARDKALWYQHSELGFNYRMSNICAAIGRGQLFDLKRRVERKREIFDRYFEGFKGSKIYMMPKDVNNSYSNCWLSVIMIDKSSNKNPIDLLNYLKERDIESRPIWKPMHMQPFYKKCEFFTSKSTPMDEDIFTRGLCIPSDIEMTNDEQDFVIKTILDFIG